MGSPPPPPRLFGRRQSLHQILGGGLVADVVLWRRREAAAGILVSAVATWLAFHLSGYTLLSLVSNVLLLFFFSVLFVWTKAATILNRIALGKDAWLFYRIAACLWIISLLGALTDFVTLTYISIVVVLTVPVLYEKYEDHVDKFLVMACMDLQHGCKSYPKCSNKFTRWILEEKKAS